MNWRKYFPSFSLEGEGQDGKNRGEINMPKKKEVALTIDREKIHRANAEDNSAIKRSATRRSNPMPKSRFAVPSISVDANMRQGNSVVMVSPRKKTFREDDGEDIYKLVDLNKRICCCRLNVRFSFGWAALLFISAWLWGCLMVKELRRSVFLGLESWKWSVLAMVIFYGMVVTNWVVRLIVYLIEKNFLLRKKVLYFVHGLKKSVQVFIWIGLIFLVWAFLFEHGFDHSKSFSKFLNFITRTLVSLLIGSSFWLIKTLLLKILASSFHVRTFFDRIQESVFHQYVLQTLSRSPQVEDDENGEKLYKIGHLSLKNVKKGKERSKIRVIDVGKVHEMTQEKVSPWTMKVLIDAVTKSRLCTLSDAIDETVEDDDDDGGGKREKEIANEMEAIVASRRIFQNVARPNYDYIDENDLSRFMNREEVCLVFPLLEGSETGKVDRKAFTNWVVKVYNERKTLAYALSDTKTAVEELNKLVSVILVVATMVIWLLLVHIATTKILVLISSQIVLAAFVFGNTCKTVFEAIIFVFVMHPFDVGDRCVVDGTPLLVEEMNLLTTIFLKLDNEKIYYPNSVLATKAIGNYYRSPDMGDSVEFSIDFGTTIEKIGLLKEGIKEYLESNPHYWHLKHSVVVEEIENLNMLKMALFCNHTMNFQDFSERNRRRSELIIQLKKIFQDLTIKYDLLPQKVHISHFG